MTSSDVYVADIFIDFVNRQLVYRSQTRQLEPKVFKLLEVLLESDGDLVSREQLNDRVWDGRVVGEGAINRTVSLLRQHFAVFDDSKNIIVTVPKAGYKLQYIERKETTPLSDRQKSGFKFSWLAASISVFVIFILFYWIYNAESQTSIVFNSATRMSALPGIEYNVSVDNSGEQLLYTSWSKQSQKVKMQLTSVMTNQVKALNGLENTSIINQQLSPNGHQIAYAYRDNDRCNIAVYQIKDQTSQNIKECALDSAPNFAWHWNNVDLYFRERVDKTQPYTISRYNLSTGRLSMMSLPPSDSNVKGDYLISHHATKNHLLVVRYLNETSATLIVLDSFNGKQRYSKQVPLHIDSAVWLTEDIIVLADKNQIYSLNINDDHLTKQLSVPLPITSMTAANNALFYSMISQVSHLVQYQLSDGTRQLIDDANAVAQLPRVSLQGDVVYLSDKTGKRQLHIIAADKQASVLSDLEMSLGFDRIEWSADGQYLLLSRQGAVYRLHVKSQKLEQIIDESAQAYVVNFGASHDDIIYGSNRSGQWQLWRFNVQTRHNEQLTKTGGYSGRIDSDNLYFTKFAQAGLWRKDLKSGKEYNLVEDVDIINWLNWQLLDQYVYFYRPDSGIWQYDLLNKKEKLVLQYNNDMLHQFSISADHQTVYITENAAVEGDVYRAEFSTVSR